MFLLNLFTRNPMAMLYVGLAIAAVSASAAGYGAWQVNGWRLGVKVEHAERERDTAIDQAKVLAESTRTCSESVELARKTSAGATKLGADLLAEARRINAGGQGAVARIEDLLKKPLALRPDGKPVGCDEAWTAIEQDYARRSK